MLYKARKEKKKKERERERKRENNLYYSILLLYITLY